ncbi:MAG: excisionase family DNA-binding protein [Propionibacteriaceae bacterium]|jgi:excisionase family DNA binding protein|nr:excisionase family DNA-binding protein [Propionibacteriaceae bacterium]
MSSLLISPDAVRSAPLGEDVALPVWARDVLAFVSRAGAGGETVELNAKVETLTPAQAAERLGLSRATISRRIADGQLRAIKVGNRHRIPVTEYDRFRRSLLASMSQHYAADIETDLLG